MPIVKTGLSPDGPLIDLVIHISSQKLTALQNAGQSIPLPVPARALIDTGASGTCIDPTIATKLKLVPTGYINILTPSTGGTPHQCAQYDVSIWLPPQHNIKFTLPVIESDSSGQSHDILLGRDILDECVLIYDGVADSVTLALQ